MIENASIAILVQFFYRLQLQPVHRGQIYLTRGWDVPIKINISTLSSISFNNLLENLNFLFSNLLHKKF